MGVFIAGTVLSSLGALGVLAVLLAVALPVGWLWMLVDALLRDDRDFPNATGNDKLLWVLLIVFVHISALAYFFIVFRAVPHGSRHAPAAA